VTLVIAIQIVAPEIVRNIEVLIAVVVEVLPRGGEREAAMSGLINPVSTECLA